MSVEVRQAHPLDIRPLPAAFSTNAMPGSAEKIATMRQRFEAGQAVFHQDDLHIDPDLGGECDPTFYFRTNYCQIRVDVPELLYA